MIRCWRNNCLERRTATKECLTTNVYACMEINSHAIVMLLDMCRDAPEQFLILCFSSQPAEELFRELRSMTTTLETAVEFSMREIGDRIRRAFMKVLVSYRQKETYTFPNIIKKMAKYPDMHQIPCRESIKHEIERARLEASRSLSELGILPDNQNFTDSLNVRDASEIEFVSAGTTLDSDEEDVEPNGFEFISFENETEEAGAIANDDITTEDETDDENAPSEEESTSSVHNEKTDATEERTYNANEIFPNFGGELKLKSSTSSKKHTFLIKDCKGKVHRIKKSKVLWMMTNGRSRQINTRLERYKQKPYTKQ